MQEKEGGGGGGGGGGVITRQAGLRLSPVPFMSARFPTPRYQGTPYKPAQAGSIVNMNDPAQVHVSMSQAMCRLSLCIP